MFEGKLNEEERQKLKDNFILTVDSGLLTRDDALLIADTMVGIMNRKIAMANEDILTAMITGDDSECSQGS